jgi:hypothetical protein
MRSRILDELVQPIDKASQISRWAFALTERGRETGRDYLRLDYKVNKTTEKV